MVFKKLAVLLNKNSIKLVKTYKKAPIHLVIGVSEQFDLSVEAVSADKLSDKAGRGDLVIDVGLVDKIEYFYHTSDLVEAFLVRLDRGQKREDVLFQYGKLVKGGAVEDNVGLLLIGEDPALLTATHRIPH